MEQELVSTQTGLRQLKAVSNAYLDIRNRWISNFIKNTYKDRFTPEDQAIIDSGDVSAHHGEPYSDALLYKAKLRGDSSIYRALYGFSYKEVLEHRMSAPTLLALTNLCAVSGENENDHKALTVLAKHATVKADTKIKSVPKSFFERFTDFTDALETGDWQTDQLQVDTAPLAEVYRNFQKELDALKPKLYKWKDAAEGKKR